MRRAMSACCVLFLGLVLMGQSFPTNSFDRGSTSSPSRAYRDDPQLGSYRIGPSNEGFASDGRLRWHWSAALVHLTAGLDLRVGGGAAFQSSVGIGTDNPTVGLHVVGSASVTSNLAVGGLNVGASNVTLASGQYLGPAADNCTSPPYSFTSDTNTGVCTSAADTLQLRAGGANYIAIGPSDITVATGKHLIGSTTSDLGTTTRWRTLYVGTGGVDSTGQILSAVGTQTTDVPAFKGTGTNTATSGAMNVGAFLQPSLNPSGAGSASMAAVHVNPIINATGDQSGTAYGFLLASRTNTWATGTIKLMSLGTTTTDGLTGYSDKFNVDINGAIESASSATFGAASVISWSGRTELRSPADGLLAITNAAETGFTRFILGTNDTSGVSLVKNGTAVQVALGDGTLGGSFMGIPVAVQTIASGNTITADACGGIKRITAAGAVTTDTTNTFTAPAAASAGCVMFVVNVGANTITLDNNANFKSPAGADVALGPDDAIIVGSTGASGVWYALSALVAN